MIRAEIGRSGALAPHGPSAEAPREGRSWAVQAARRVTKSARR